MEDFPNRHFQQNSKYQESYQRNSAERKSADVGHFNRPHAISMAGGRLTLLVPAIRFLRAVCKTRSCWNFGSGWCLLIHWWDTNIVLPMSSSNSQRALESLVQWIIAWIHLNSGHEWQVYKHPGPCLLSLRKPNRCCRLYRCLPSSILLWSKPSPSWPLGGKQRFQVPLSNPRRHKS